MMQNINNDVSKIRLYLHWFAFFKNNVVGPHKKSNR